MPGQGSFSDPPVVARTRLWGVLVLLSIPLTILLPEELLPCGIAAGPISAAGMLTWRRYRMKRVARTAGYQLCPSCGYDMHALPNAAACPECGAAYNKADAEAVWRAWCLEEHASED